MYRIIFCYCLLILACSRKSHPENKTMTVLQPEKVRVDGIYQGVSRNFDPNTKQYIYQYPYLKFYQNGYVVSGIAVDSLSLTNKIFDNLDNMDPSKAGSQYTFYDSLIYVEQIYSGMKTGRDFLVYRIDNKETLTWIGSGRKPGKLEEPLPAPVIFRFKPR